MAEITSVFGQQAGYDRALEVKQFDDSKIGVKGLFDSGLSSIPRIFIHPPQTFQQQLHLPDAQSIIIPTIDLSGLHSDRHSALVDQVSRACRNFGFFQIINHGIPSEIMDSTLAAVKAFHEQPTEVRAQFYRRGRGLSVSYFSNAELLKAKTATWSDTLRVRLGPVLVADDLPEVCRDEIVAWNEEIQRLGVELLGLVSEGLGLPAQKLKEMTCLEGRVMAGHYYPPCMQPDMTLGLTSHSDPGVLNVLLQNHVGRLQVKHGGAWVDVKVVPGALVINVGDLLQMISNEEYKSVEHRVLANTNNEPRVSIAVFLNPGDRDSVYGPLPELVSPEKPALYKEFKFTEFTKRFFEFNVEVKPLNYFKVAALK